jgi:DNA-binding winged helix-turn-helix (wHTH) protein
MSNLRRKLGATAAGDERIRNVRGSGYMYLGQLRTSTDAAEANHQPASVHEKSV